MVTIKDIKHLIKDAVKITLVVDIYRSGILVGSTIPIKSQCYNESFTEYENKEIKSFIISGGALIINVSD